MVDSPCRDCGSGLARHIRHSHSTAYTRRVIIRAIFRQFTLIVASCLFLIIKLVDFPFIMPFAGKHVFRPPPTATAAPPAAARSRDADESNDEDFSSEEESSSEEEDEENEEGAGDAGSSADLSDHPQQEEEADSPNLWDNGPVMPLASPPLAPDRDPIPSTERPRRTPSARLVDDSGLTRFVPRAEADGWAAAIAATAGPGPRSTGLGFASQHAQGMTLFERFFSNSHSPS